MAPIQKRPSGKSYLFGGEKVIWSKFYETKWIEDISHAKSHEKAKGFKAFLILNLMNPIIELQIS